MIYKGRNKEIARVRNFRYTASKKKGIMNSSICSKRVTGNVQCRLKRDPDNRISDNTKENEGSKNLETYRILSGRPASGTHYEKGK